MTTVLNDLDVTTRVLKRAQYEAFAFELTDGGVRVRNESHANPADHEYRVAVTDGVPTQCTCPADERFDGACKHRVAVAIRKPVLAAASYGQVSADGGTTTLTSFDDDADIEAERPADCDCANLGGEFPCWPCVRAGRRDLPE